MYKQTKISKNVKRESSRRYAGGMQSGLFVCPEHDHLFAGLRTTGPGTMSSPRQRTLMHRVAIVLGLLFAGLEQVSNAFVFRIPPSKLATCRENDPTACAMAMVAESWQLLPSSERSSRAQGAEDLHRQRYRGQVGCYASCNTSILIESAIDGHIIFISLNVSQSALASHNVMTTKQPLD